MRHLMGVVLCGGKSTRMGTDKGLLSINDTYWAKHIANMFTTLKIPSVLSICKDQEGNYLKLLPSASLIKDSELPVKGPLKGLLSVHEQFPSYDLLLMACDMVDMEINTLRDLVAVYHADSSFNFYVYRHNDFVEPFCGIYSASGLKAVMEKVNSNTLHRNSLQYILEKGNTKKLVSSSGKSFNNYNSTDDLSIGPS